MPFPRLKLQAALMASRISCLLCKELEIDIKRRIYWTDSKIVFCWIKNDPHRYNIFVANRLGEIDENTNVSEWRWIPSEENVANDATR